MERDETTQADEKCETLEAVLRLPVDGFHRNSSKSSRVGSK
jgi:hypothetical protein